MTLFAGPFLGEFGWEVCIWAPWLRYVSETSREDMVVLCRPGHRWLYQDFAEAFPIIENHKPAVKKVDACIAWIEGRGKANDELYFEILRQNLKMTGRKPSRGRHLTPNAVPYTWTSGTPSPRLHVARYRKLGKGDPTGTDVVVHVRNCDAHHPHRNWKRDSAQTVVSGLRDCGHSVIAIGTRDGALCPDGAIDYRGQPIAKVCSEIGPTTIVVGPSSGPMHLAQHAGARIVLWSGFDKSRPRYEKDWNPHGCKVDWVGLTWDPDPQLALDVVKQAVEDVNR
jgi:hypothetical protein